MVWVYWGASSETTQDGRPTGNPEIDRDTFDWHVGWGFRVPIDHSKILKENVFQSHYSSGVTRCEFSGEYCIQHTQKSMGPVKREFLLDIF